MRLYHGSENIIEHPQYGFGKKTNDYGQGFYCTEDLEMAKEWACGENRDGWANEYDLDMTGLRVLNLNEEPYHILNWLALLAKYRTYWQNGAISYEAKKYIEDYFLPDVSDYDVIIGYRADDSYFSFAQDFAAGVLSLQKLSRAMRLGSLGEQVVLKSEAAFECVQFCGNVLAPASIYFPKRMERDEKARAEYRRMKEEGTDIRDLFILDIMREEIQNGDSRLFL